jgi:UDP-N-acetyl-D-galactosamine dehydrogenase
MIATGSNIKGSKVNVFGLTFKEDCADLRNSKVVDIINELKSYGCDVYVHDTEADPGEAMYEYGVQLTDWHLLPPADAIVAAVGHKFYRGLSLSEVAGKAKRNGCFIDVKSNFDAEQLKQAGLSVWRL